MRRVFADTYYFLALVNPHDRAHGKATAFSAAWDVQIVTTEWVMAELGNTLSRAPGRRAFVGTLKNLLADPHSQIIPASGNLFRQGFDLYASRLDKEWSMTDCISFVVMREHGLLEALTADRHFEQAGFKPLLA